MIAEKIKKKIKELPKRAEEGRFLILSIAATIRSTIENKGIFFEIEVIGAASVCSHEYKIQLHA